MHFIFPVTSVVFFTHLAQRQASLRFWCWLRRERSWLLRERSWLLRERRWLLRERRWLLRERSWLLRERRWLLRMVDLKLNITSGPAMRWDKVAQNGFPYHNVIMPEKRVMRSPRVSILTTVSRGHMLHVAYPGDQLTWSPNQPL